MSDLSYALHVARRMTPLEWLNGLASVGLIVIWTLHALSRGAGG